MSLKIISSIISGIISGVIASLIINWYYWNKKPKLIISKQIAKNKKNEYRIKIVNLSKFYITNIFIQLQLVTVSNGDGGIILNVNNLDIPYKSLQVINPYNKNDPNALYAIRFVVPNSLEEKWKNDEHTYLKLIVYCSNEHNNASKLYEQMYHKKSQCIKQGYFKFGVSLEIEEY